jgi:hypothetical protein
LLQLWFSRLIALLLVCGLWWGVADPAQAALNDDHFDGNIFVLYAGNGSLVPPRVSLADSLVAQKPSLLVFYTDDSRDCKQFAGVVSQLQAYYGRATNFIPVTVDSLGGKQYSKTEPGFYYQGKIPQTVLLDGQGKVVYQTVGLTGFNPIDDAFRDLFHRPARTPEETRELQPFNEFNSDFGQ